MYFMPYKLVLTDCYSPNIVIKRTLTKGFYNRSADTHTFTTIQYSENPLTNIKSRKNFQLTQLLHCKLCYHLRHTHNTNHQYIQPFKYLLHYYKIYINTRQVLKHYNKSKNFNQHYNYYFLRFYHSKSR